MWLDNETSRDYLNFSSVADTAAEIIVDAKGAPISLGVFGNWGVGKSSLIKLIRSSLENSDTENNKFLFIEFNAWLYQGYDDAKSALMDVIANTILEHAKDNGSLREKAIDLIHRVDSLKLLGAATDVGTAIAFGVPLGGGLGKASAALKGLFDGSIENADITAAKESAIDTKSFLASLLKDKPENSPPKQIQEFRTKFEELLAELNVTLVVLIDDLDRCLPQTAISTLEAIRLLLFLKHTAFVIAADEKMIRSAVKKHFSDGDTELVTNYLDKLIQIPLRVPPLGTQEVRAYLMQLYIENSSLNESIKESARIRICSKLGETWKGERVDRDFVTNLVGDSCGAALNSKLDVAERLAPLMASSKQIGGNPRLIKRFLNTLSIRESLARQQSFSVDGAVLAKLLLFERCVPERAYAHLLSEINNSEDGKPAFLKCLEVNATEGKELEGIPDEWGKDEFYQSWLQLPPKLAEVDLRPAIFVGREHLPLISKGSELSSEASSLLGELMVVTFEPDHLNDRIRTLAPVEQNMILDHLLGALRNQSLTSKNNLIYGSLSLAKSNTKLGLRFTAFLNDLPVSSFGIWLVPYMKGFEGAQSVLEHWNKDAEGPMKKAIEKGIKDNLGG